MKQMCSEFFSGVATRDTSLKEQDQSQTYRGCQKHEEREV